MIHRHQDVPPTGPTAPPILAARRSGLDTPSIRKGPESAARTAWSRVCAPDEYHDQPAEYQPGQ
jgi:hypothetical protein